MMLKKMHKKKRFTAVLLLLLVLLILILLFSLATGTIRFHPAELLLTLSGKGRRQQAIALYSIRLPRLTIALVVGSALAVAGAILQSITNNDLAEPGIMGITSGSALFVVIYIYLTNGRNYYSVSSLTIFTMPLLAFLGGLTAALIVYGLAWKGGIRRSRLLLVGIAVNAAFSAIITILQLRFQTKDFNKVLMWTTGSIWGSSWSYVIAVAPVILLLILLVYYRSRYLDVFSLGDETAAGLGVHVEKTRALLLLLAVALSGCAAAVAGNVSFVGLMSPHIAKKLVGPRHQLLLPISALTGMILVAGADTIARNLFAPIELNLGTVVSVIGVPYFIYLVLKE